MDVVFASRTQKPEHWLPTLRQALPTDRIFAWPEVPSDARVEVVLVVNHDPQTFASPWSLKLVQSLTMGVDGLLADPLLPADVTICRCVDPMMATLMGEVALAHALDFHRQHHTYRRLQAERRWERLPQPAAAARIMVVLGLGTMGREVCRRLLDQGFTVRGWSRRAREIAGIQCYSGAEGLVAATTGAHQVICLLPLTKETRGVLCAELFARLARGASVVNLARGPHLLWRDALQALDTGQLAHVYLDAFDQEPLPADHPLWGHTGVDLTPHVAALIDPSRTIPLIIANIERLRAGEPLADHVERSAGY